jgi:MFS family permease
MLSNRWVVLALLFAVRVSTGIQYQAVASLSPQLMSGFVLSIADIGLLIGLYHAPGTILAFPGGAIGAWLGDKPVVLIGLALMAIGEIGAATAPTWPILMGARIVAGTGGILLNVMIIKMVADWFTSKETATAMAIIGSSAPAGIALALATIPWIASSGDRALASISVVVYLVLAFVALAAAYKAPDEASAVAQRQSLWPERRVVVCLITAGLIYGLYNVGLVTILAFGPLMLTERGWSFAAGSSATSLVLWIVTISLPAGGLLADRIGRRALVLVCGLLAFAATMAVAPRVDAVFAIFLLLGMTSGLPCGAIMALPTQVLAPEMRSVGMGIMFTVYYAVNVGGPWLVGLIAKQAGSARFAFDASAISLGVAVILWLFFRHLASRSPFIEKAQAVNRR